MNTHRLRRNSLMFLVYFFLLFVAVVTLMPFYTMLISSTHDNLNIVTRFNILPGTSFLDNYERLNRHGSIWLAMRNSAIIGVSGTLLGLYFPAMAGYAFSKIHFKGNRPLFTFVLVAMMIPGQLSMIGFFKLMVDLSLINSYIPLIIPAIASSFGVFFFKQYLDGSIPNEIIEASIIDGCSEVRLFHRIILPLMVPALATQGVLSFIGHWNSFLTPMMILNNRRLMPLAVYIAGIRSGAGAAEYGAQYVGILISVIPIVIIFAFCSRLILDRVSIGSAIKG